jgi:two-component system KDP operon response regulator KdpE
MIILIISDDPQMVRFLRTALAAYDFDILTYQNYLDALGILENLPIDLIVLDITVPNLEGFEPIRPIREATDAPIIVLSTLPTEYDRQVALSMGASGYLLKPFGIAELMSLVYDLLG